MATVAQRGPHMASPLDTPHHAGRATLPPVSVSRRRVWTGRVLTSIAGLFLLADGVVKLTGIQPVVDAFDQLGYPSSQAAIIGSLLLACLAVHLIPRTSILGAILLTGYLGGAVAVQARVENPLFGYVLFPVYVGLLIWVGLYLRTPRVRGLLSVS
ncbi:MAG TPA: DoxX family protein [Longimicrobiales bacterium]|nr:DoxX family protein [Longimicrobiales bacterium]